MGLFRKNREHLPIHIKEQYKNSLIHPYSNRLSNIKLGENLTVDEGWSVVIVAKGKSQEIFNAGQYQLSIATLPNTSRTLNLNKSKVKKHRNDVQMVMPDNFDCDLYFVNLKPFDNIPWKTGKIGIRSKRYGMYRVKIGGTLSVQVNKPMDFIHLFLYQWSHIPAGKWKHYLCSLLDEECEILLTKSDYTDPNDFLDNDKITQYLTENLNKSFAKYGMKIENVVVVTSDISGKVATMLQAEQNGNSGLAERVEKDINSTITANQGNLSIPVDISIDNIIEDDIQVVQPEKDLVFVGATRQISQDVQAVASGTNNDEFNLSNIINTTNNTILDKNQQNITQQVQDIQQTPQNLNLDSLLSDTTNKFGTQENAQRTINLADNIICPKCGSIMLGGLCINCEKEKDKNND